MDMRGDDGKLWGHRYLRADFKMNSLKSCGQINLIDL